MRKRQKAKLMVGLGLTGLLGSALAGAAVAADTGDTGNTAVPEWFDPVSSSWTSSDTGYVLGWTPCDEQEFCTSILATEDGGQTWTERPAPDLKWNGAEKKRRSMFFTEQNGKLVGLIQDGYDGAFATYDGGETWAAEDFAIDSEDWSVAGMKATAAHAYVLVDEGDGIDTYYTTLYRSPIGADQWEQVGNVSHPGGYGGDLTARGNTAAAFLSGDDYFQGKLWTTSDGTEWTKQQRPCSPDGLQSYVSGGQGRVYAYCDQDEAGQRVMASDDGGATFTEVSKGAVERVSVDGIAAYGDTIVHSNGYGYVDAGCTAHSSFDGGATWNTFALEGSDIGTAVDFQLTDEGTGTAVCYDAWEVGGGVLSRTTDGGKTWAPLRLTNEE